MRNYIFEKINDFSARFKLTRGITKNNSDGTKQSFIV